MSGIQGKSVRFTFLFYPLLFLFSIVLRLILLFCRCLIIFHSLSVSCSSLFICSFLQPPLVINTIFQIEFVPFDQTVAIREIFSFFLSGKIIPAGQEVRGNPLT